MAETARLGYLAARDGLDHGEDRYWPTTEIRDALETGLFERSQSRSAPGISAPLAEDEWLRRARIPVKHHGSTFARWLPEDGQPRLQIEAWTRQWPPVCPWLVCVGSTGAGKTHLAVAAARYLALTYGVLSQFWTPYALEARYKATYDRETAIETESHIDQIFMRSQSRQGDPDGAIPLLILDDLGTTNSTAWSEGKLFALLNARYEAEAPTIFTLNVAPEKLGHERIYSRLMDRQSTQRVVFTQADYRLGGKR